MADVMIGVDPHKGSHTAVAVGERDRLLGQLRVQAMARQAEVLLDWAKSWPQRTWAIEGARGLGYLLAQQLSAAGERVVDISPKLAARVRLLIPARSTRPTPTTPARSRSPRCAPGSCARSTLRTTAR